MKENRGIRVFDFEKPSFLPSLDKFTDQNWKNIKFALFVMLFLALAICLSKVFYLFKK